MSIKVNKMNPRDLLNIDKMKELEQATDKLKKFAAKEQIKKMGKGKDNFEELNKLNTEGGKMAEWGVEPND